MPTNKLSTPTPTSPANTSFASNTDSASRKSYTGELYGYYYSALSAWGGPSEMKLTDNEPTYILGERHCGQETNQWTNAKVRAVSYYTYRNRFPAPLSNGADHDAGWGCMIRTGQMMMSEALRRVSRVKLPPQPLRKVKESELASLAEQQPSSGPSSAAQFQSSGAGTFPSPHNGRTSPTPLLSRQNSQEAPAIFGLTPEQSETFHRVSAMFYDHPDAPFGIHKMTAAGAKAAKVPVGEWFTPTALARTLESILSNDPALDHVRSRLSIVASYDGVVSMEELDGHFSNNKAVLLLVPVMLGVGTLNASYQKAFLALMECPLTLGVVGGKPRQSLYFVGHQRDTCFYLDPHTVQPSFVSPTTIGQRYGPRGNTPVSSIDPCMLLCFLFESEIEHQMFQQFFFTELRQLTEYPLFAYAQKKKAAAIADDVVDDMDFDDSDDDASRGMGTTPPQAKAASSSAVVSKQSPPSPSATTLKRPVGMAPPPLHAPSTYSANGSGQANANPFMNMGRGNNTNDSFGTPTLLNRTTTLSK